MEKKRGIFREYVRLWILSAPLFLPLVVICGVLWGGSFWCLAIVAGAVAVICSQWRVLIACVLCAVVALLHSWRLEYRQELFFEQAEAQAPLSITGTVERELSSGCIIRDDASGARIVLRGETVPFRAGDRICVDAELLPPQTSPIRGMFDSSAWLRSQGLAATAYCTEATYLGHPFSVSAIRGFADSVRSHLAGSLMPSGCETDARAQILCALVLGDKTYSDPETVNIFKRGGCLHIFAVSGLHVGIVAGIVYFILSRFMLRTRLRTVLLLLITALYVGMTGLAVPALRAFLMLALLLLGKELKRPVGMVNIWSAAAILVLLLSPWQIHNAGFLLSFAVYAAIGIGIRYGMRSGAWFHPDPFLPARIYNKRERFIVNADYWLRGLVVMSMCAWLASLPITMSYFHTFNAYGIFVNIVITPLLMPTMLCGLLSLLPWVGAFLHGIAMACAGVLLSIVGFFSDIPGAYLPMQVPQEADALMVYHTGYSDSFCVLGNPGIIINCGSEKTARFCTEPALFHGGFQPTMLLLTQRRASCGGGQGVLTESFPGMQVLAAWSQRDEIRSYMVGSGSVTLIFPSSELNRTPVQNATPIIRWQGQSRTVLYVGDASLLTFERIPQELLNADVVICGRNPALPVTPQLIADTIPSAQIILLPTAASYDAADLPTSAGVKLFQVGTHNPCLILGSDTNVP